MKNAKLLWEGGSEHSKRIVRVPAKERAERLRRPRLGAPASHVQPSLGVQLPIRSQRSQFSQCSQHAGGLKIRR